MRQSIAAKAGAYERAFDRAARSDLACHGPLQVREAAANARAPNLLQVQ